MKKNCRVIMNNTAVTVVDYDGVEIQFPAINEQKSFVDVSYDKKNETYTLMKEEKKTTLEESVIEDDNICEECKITSTQSDK